MILQKVGSDRTIDAKVAEVFAQLAPRDEDSGSVKIGDGYRPNYSL
jgi:hypothetical protein